MFVNNINPTLFHLGSLEIRYYGIIYALGFVISIYFMKYYIKKGYLKLSEEKLYDFFFWFMIGIVVGARLFEVLIWEPQYYFSNPQYILAVWRGGLSFHGSIVGAIIVTYIFAKKNNLSFYRMADLLVIPVSIATALGRVGNFLNSELVGTPTNQVWCVQFPKVDDLCRHPYQLYSGIKRLAIFFVLYFLNEKKHKEGFIFWMFITLIGLGRFFIEYFKDDKILFLFNTGQWLSIATFAIGLTMLLQKYRKDLKNLVK